MSGHFYGSLPDTITNLKDMLIRFGLTADDILYIRYGTGNGWSSPFYWHWCTYEDFEKACAKGRVMLNYLFVVTEMMYFWASNPEWSWVENCTIEDITTRWHQELKIIQPKNYRKIEHEEPLSYDEEGE